MRRKPTEQEVMSRISRVNELLMQELGEILTREGRMPEGVFATITKVDTAPNMQQARVYVSTIPEEQEEEVFRALSRDVYDVQQALNKRLKMRPVPKIRWVPDRVAPEIQRVEELLNKIEKEEL